MINLHEWKVYKLKKVYEWKIYEYWNVYKLKLYKWNVYKWEIVQKRKRIRTDTSIE